MSRFGIILKELRRANGFTQAGLAERIGVTNGTISHWEKGMYEPNATYIILLADLFNVTADSLLGRDKPCEDESHDFKLSKSI